MAPPVSARTHKDFPEKYADVYIPVSLAAGTVRTPEFPVVVEAYDILIQVQRTLPIGQMICMMGATSNPFESKNCTSADPLLQTEWTVSNEGRVVAHGSNAPSGGSSIAKDRIWKLVGSFAGEAGKKYVVEVKFTKDGTPLNGAEPRLVVIKHKKFW
ncbi:hypothetical protein [Terriglobus albidus]|uniref:hypothetical protein n=1 Tax=Terriglobus albidus TaxID=1592106 RepID=UPI0021E0813C|nr:hypothetical protein [Terriglobus albidus]